MKRSCFRWTKGNGEIIGFAVSVILLLFLIVSIVSYTSLTTKKQQLSVAAYAAGRAAAVSHDDTLAKARAAKVLETIYDSYYSSEESNTVGSVWYEIEYDDWKIGNIFTITVYHRFGGMFPFPEKTRSYKYAMMIEAQTPNY